MGQLDKGIALLERWKEYAKRVGRGAIVECEYCLPLAEGYLAQGDVDRAQANADEALQIALEKGYAFQEARGYRILGEILAPTDFPSAEDHFSRSLEIMQRIKACNEEGKTELSWGRACQQHGDMDQARAHLTRAAEIFEELGTTRYLEWAQEVLARL
jgi:tetratricopeptide (TPR) repeat protein